MSSDFLNWDLGNIPRQAPIDAQKANVTVKTAAMDVAKKTQRQGMKLMFTLDDHPSASPIFDTSWLPIEGDSPENVEIMLGMLRDRFEGLGYDYSHITGFDQLEQHVEELIDLQAGASVGFTPKNEKEGWPAKNTIKALFPR